MAKLPAPDWLALASARQCALAAFTENDPEEVTAALLRALKDDKVAVRARCKQWFEHTLQVEIGPYVWAAGAVDVDWKAGRFTIWLERAPHTFTNAEARRVDLEKWLGTTPAPTTKFEPDGHTFIDAAANLVMGRIGCPTGPALSMLLEAFRSGKIRTWRRQEPSEPYKLSADNWVGADVDLQEFQSLGHSGLRLGQRKYHLHRILISADDLEYFLKQQGSIGPAQQPSIKAGPLPDVVATPNNRVHFPDEDWYGQNASRAEIAARRDAGLHLMRSGQESADAIPLPAVRGPVPTSALMTGCETLTWIAFGKAQPKGQFGEAILVSFWGTTELDDLRIALAARAASAPYCPLESDFYKPDHVKDFFSGLNWARSMRALRMRVRRAEGSLASFPDLQDRLDRDLAWKQSADALLDAATRVLLEALRAGRTTAFGRRHGGEPQEVLATAFFDRSITVTWWDTIEDEHHGIRFTDVQFRTDDALRLWPADAATAASVATQAPQPTEAATAAEPQRRNAGGRPRMYDWDAFDREIVRIALTPDGFPEKRPELIRHMTDWCERTWGKTPADSMIRDRIARLSPD